MVFFVLFFGGCVSFDTVSNPASPLVRLQECCEHSGLPLSLFSLCVDWRLAFLSKSDCLSDFQPQSVLCSFGRISSVSLTSDRLMLCVFSSSGTLPFLLQRHCVSRRRCSSACEYLCLCVSPFPRSVCSSILPSVHLEPVELWRYNLCQRPPESSFLVTLTPSSPSLTGSPLTGFIHTGDSRIQTPAGSLQKRSKSY